MAEYIEREAAIDAIMKVYVRTAGYKARERVFEAEEAVHRLPVADVEKMSDGYHTFADLYEQRLILSAALAKNNPHAWKSKRHEDGSVPFGGGWFIMGFDTDEGCYTYHYELKDWDLFQCKELDRGKPWDGHTSKDVRRLLSIPADDVAPVVRCKDCKYYRVSALLAPHKFCFRLKHPEEDRPIGYNFAPDDFCSYGERKDGGSDAQTD
ncbi:WDGH domain-containing protein [Leyella stercorea]|uniref:WDGH domain-containing protein n=1 Tax=Leyella stercorea TaxID=363265 RepID=UPI00242E9979|nr:hypothetical protein [Leyella stercorea]